MEYRKNPEVHPGPGDVIVMKEGMVAIQSPNFGRGRQAAHSAAHSHVDPARGTTMWYERRIRELEARNELLELAASYAKDVIDFWPLMTLRTIRVMIPKMASLKEALEMLRDQDRS